jgi:hypothetical protein
MVQSNYTIFQWCRSLELVALFPKSVGRLSLLQRLLGGFKRGHTPLTFKRVDRIWVGYI